MLDFLKIARQMQGVSRQLAEEAQRASRRLEEADRVLGWVRQNQQAVIARTAEVRPKITFLVGEPVEALGENHPVVPVPPVHTVIATDGSQIAPSHHEIAYCSLINVGKVCLHYGTGERPLLDSQPEVFYREEDLYGPWGLNTEESLALRRSRAEMEVLADVALDCGAGERPAVALVDGSLIYWQLEQVSTKHQQAILEPMLAAWERLRERRIPVAGYISSSRSGDAMNFLRLQLCPHPDPDCDRHCTGNTGRGAPCGILHGLSDRRLFDKLLAPGERSGLWASTSRILEHYGPHRVHFCYLHVGSEIARVEMPAWVALDAELRERVLGACLAQVEKGFGYPVALAEAHNRAVVQGGDRARFFAMLEAALLKAGLSDVRVSRKEARKRGSIA
ncbi:DNA double-strand break repair nuclease NurA [Gloeobacter morelensis]|uniref:DNA double-strand break repair nuclease NurA n=1 Tax=Gloeobacter morelensis MG652769 TaxID=2781736 RepID=A0ABY3PN36_9CYAN|nr:DNA double-strand break repair nuclease NurA [Gloeobacter morelensis]UFP95108.1 DNA double-strand break repair nuclease NurA [Gloeobacter morelensis MG652769]